MFPINNAPTNKPTKNPSPPLAIAPTILVAIVAILYATNSLLLFEDELELEEDEDEYAATGRAVDVDVRHVEVERAGAV